MTKEEFQTKIEAGKTVIINCYSFRKFSGLYFYSTPQKIENNFDNFESFWNCVSTYVQHINKNQNCLDDFDREAETEGRAKTQLFKFTPRPQMGRKKC